MTLRLRSGQARLILALALVLSAAPAFAQAEADDWTVQDRREAARERREEARERRQEAREAARERAEEWREARREDWERWRREGRDGVHFRILRNYYLAADATAKEPIVVMGGDATIDGQTDDDVVVIGGTLRLGPKAVVGGDVVTVGGEAVIDPAATVRGNVDAAVVHLPNIDWGLRLADVETDRVGLGRHVAVRRTVGHSAAPESRADGLAPADHRCAQVGSARWASAHRRH